MKSNFILILLFAGYFVSSCSSPKYLPAAGEVGSSLYGAHIEIDTKKKKEINGELIAVDTVSLVVLTSKKNDSAAVCEVVSIADIRKFSLEYAKPSHYGWSIPLYAVSTLTHGFWLSITAPANLIITTIVTATGENAHVLKKNHLSYDEMKKFARYPQGIPTGVELKDISR